MDGQSIHHPEERKKGDDLVEEDKVN